MRYLVIVANYANFKFTKSEPPDLKFYDGKLLAMAVGRASTDNGGWAVVVDLKTGRVLFDNAA